MRIAAGNIRAGGGRRVEAIARQLGRWAPDVVALGEFRATAPSAGLACALAAHGLVHQRSTADAVALGANCLLVASPPAGPRDPTGRGSFQSGIDSHGRSVR